MSSRVSVCQEGPWGGPGAPRPTSVKSMVAAPGGCRCPASSGPASPDRWPSPAHKSAAGAPASPGWPPALTGSPCHPAYSVGARRWSVGAVLGQRARAGCRLASWRRSRPGPMSKSPAGWVVQISWSRRVTSRDRHSASVQGVSCLSPLPSRLTGTRPLRRQGSPRTDGPCWHASQRTPACARPVTIAEALAATGATGA